MMRCTADQCAAKSQLGVMPLIIYAGASESPYLPSSASHYLHAKPLCGDSYVTGQAEHSSIKSSGHCIPDSKLVTTATANHSCV